MNLSVNGEKERRPRKENTSLPVDDSEGILITHTRLFTSLAVTPNWLLVL